MNKEIKETLDALNILSDLQLLEDAFIAFSNMTSYEQFTKFVSEFISCLEVIDINAEFDIYEYSCDDIEWLNLSTDFTSFTFENIGVKIVFDYTCSFSTESVYIRENQKYMIQINQKFYKLDEATELLLVML
jgi:hypothetical protein